LDGEERGWWEMSAERWGERGAKMAADGTAAAKLVGREGGVEEGWDVAKM
jgi:hypothetical protein